MTNTSKLIGIAAIMAVSFASPAFAQRPAVRAYDSGVNAFAMAPPIDGSSLPAASGGGSFGYNESLRRDEW